MEFIDTEFPPILIRLLKQIGKPSSTIYQLPHDVTVSLIHGRRALPVGDMSALPDVVTDDIHKLTGVAA